MAEKATILYPPSKRVTSEVWKYFGYPKNADGSIVDDGFPVCKICGRQVASQGRNTSNMFAHLRSNHPVQFKGITESVGDLFGYSYSSKYLPLCKRKTTNKFRPVWYRARVNTFPARTYLAQRKESSGGVENSQQLQESPPVYSSSETDCSSVTHDSPDRTHGWMKQEPKNELIEWENTNLQVPTHAEQDNTLSNAISTTTPAEGLPTCDMLACTKMKCLLESKQEKIDALEKQVQDLHEDRKFLRTQIENLTSTLSAFVRDGVTRRIQES